MTASAGGAVVGGYELDLMTRLGNAAISLWRYPGMLLWPHDLAFLCPGSYLKAIRKRVLLYDKRVISSCLERVGKSFENSLTVVMYH